MSSRFPIHPDFKSFLLIMCIDAPESTTNSLSSGLRVDGADRHQFSEGEKNVVLCFSLENFRIFLASLHAGFTGTSLLPFRLFLRPILKFRCIGVTLMRITWANHSKRWILVSNVSVTWHGFCESNTSDWLQYVWALPQNRWRLRRLHILKYATQLSCILQYSHCTFITIPFRLLARLFVNLAVCARALFTESASFFWLVGQAFRRMPFFTEWIGASSFEVILARQSSHFPTGLLPLGLRVLDAFLTLCCAEDPGEGFGCVDFARLSSSCRKLQLSPSEHCPWAYHCPQSPRLLCSRCFTHDSWARRLFHNSHILASKFFTLKFCSILLFDIVFNLW